MEQRYRYEDLVWEPGLWESSTKVQLVRDVYWCYNKNKNRISFTVLQQNQALKNRIFFTVLLVQPSTYYIIFMRAVDNQYMIEFYTPNPAK